jgi:hypothetical protein
MAFTDAGVKFLGRFVVVLTFPFLLLLPLPRATVPVSLPIDVVSVWLELLGVASEEALLLHPRLAIRDPNSPDEVPDDAETGAVLSSPSETNANCEALPASIISVMSWLCILCWLSLLGLESAIRKDGCCTGSGNGWFKSDRVRDEAKSEGRVAR